MTFSLIQFIIWNENHTLEWISAHKTNLSLSLAHLELDHRIWLKVDQHAVQSSKPLGLWPVWTEKLKQEVWIELHGVHPAGTDIKQPAARHTHNFSAWTQGFDVTICTYEKAQSKEIHTENTNTEWISMEFKEHFKLQLQSS